jgi:exodeoxyribonuclease VII small subunit
MPLSPNPDAGTGSTQSSGDPSSFEAAYAELQQVVAQLDDGGIDLERAVVLFERGSQLVRVCERIVDEAELRVTRLTAETASPLADAVDS